MRMVWKAICLPAFIVLPIPGVCDEVVLLAVGNACSQRDEGEVAGRSCRLTRRDQCAGSSIPVTSDIMCTGY